MLLCLINTYPCFLCLSRKEGQSPPSNPLSTGPIFNLCCHGTYSVEIFSYDPDLVRQLTAPEIMQGFVTDYCTSASCKRDSLQTVGAIPSHVGEIAPVDNCLSRLNGLWDIFLTRQYPRPAIMSSLQAVGAEGAADLEIEAMKLVKWLVFALSQPVTYLFECMDVPM